MHSTPVADKTWTGSIIVGRRWWRITADRLRNAVHRASVRLRQGGEHGALSPVEIGEQPLVGCIRVLDGSTVLKGITQCRRVECHGATVRPGRCDVNGQRVD